MGILSSILKKRTAELDNRPVLQRLVSYVESNSIDKAIPMLASKETKGNPIAIPYTPEAIANDFASIRQCMNDFAMTEDELSALVATQLLKKHPNHIKNLLAESGYNMPSMDRIIYLNTCVTSISSLQEFASIGIKNYRISTCGVVVKLFCNICG